MLNVFLEFTFSSPPPDYSSLGSRYQPTQHFISNLLPQPRPYQSHLLRHHSSTLARPTAASHIPLHQYLPSPLLQIAPPTGLELLTPQAGPCQLVLSTTTNCSTAAVVVGCSAAEAFARAFTHSLTTPTRFALAGSVPHQALRLGPLLLLVVHLD